MKRLLLLTCAVCLSGAGVAQAVNIPITMEWDSVIGQTTVFRGDITVADASLIPEVLIVDGGLGGGSSGVFSGFDLDFLLFDSDGDFSTTGDQITPLTGEQTEVFPGLQRPGIGPVGPVPSIYQPTLMHPGDLFGVDEAGLIDHATATLGTLDTVYIPGYYLSVDSSNGWVSIGDDGEIVVSFDVVSLGQGQTITLFVGRTQTAPAGVPTVFDATVTATVIDQPPVGDPLVHVINYSSEPAYEMHEAESVIFTIRDPGTLLPPGALDEWDWDLDADGLYDDGTGMDVPVTYDQLVQDFGLSTGSTYVLGVRDGDGNNQTPFMVTLVPEPGVVSLLALGGLVGLLRRRRSRR